MYSLKYKLETTKKQIPVLNTCLEDVANSTIRTVHTKNAQKTQKNRIKSLYKKRCAKIGRKKNAAQKFCTARSAVQKFCTKKRPVQKFCTARRTVQNFCTKKSDVHFS